MNTPARHYVLRHATEPGNPNPIQFYFGFGSAAILVEPEKATRYATRELAETMAPFIPGPCVVDCAPVTRVEKFREKLYAERESTGYGVQTTVDELIERFDELFPPNESAVTELPPGYQETRWVVVVSNVGTVYAGPREAEARRTYMEYVKISKAGIGRAHGESVILMLNGEIEDGYEGTQRDE